MSHMTTPYCTLCAKNGVRKDLAPYEGYRSKGWRYCDECYIRRFPAAAFKRGLVKEAPPKAKKAKKAIKPVKPVQLALFQTVKPTVIGCGCQGNLPGASNLNQKGRK